MKISSFAVLGLAYLCLLPFTQGEVVRYQMALEENGTKFTERIEIDEEEDVEVFRVPAYNNVEGADFYHDFKKRLTVTRILSRKICYISELDLSISPPSQLKADLDRVSSLADDLPVVTESTVVMINGQASKLLLTKEILDFCEAFPIYNTTNTKVSSNDGNETVSFIRNSRQSVESNFQFCLEALGRDPFENVIKGGCIRPDEHWDLQCKFEQRAFLTFMYYYVTCHDQLAFGRLQDNCRSVRKSYKIPTCCDYICAT
ncbi:uncharacterized protein [Montipora foliosa]|uniref:uncharacterized protein n=1 Tax=Montipora foliosa TaxID=591990 RepID=UPI0035F1967A